MNGNQIEEVVFPGFFSHLLRGCGGQHPNDALLVKREKFLIPDRLVDLADRIGYRIDPV